MRKIWRIVQDIYEGDDREPVLTHVFYGETIEAAKGIYSAHMQTDSFMNGCVTKHKFRDFSCYARERIERFDPHAGWVPA